MKRSLPVKVAIIDNSLFPEIYRPVVHWSKYLTVPWQAFRARERQWPSLNQDFTHFILTGSEATILEKELWVEEETELLRQLVDRGYPVLGSCWGHQLLAVALIGEQAVRRCEQPEIGWIEVKVTNPSSIIGASDNFYSFSIHFDEVCQVNDEFEVIATSPLCPIQAMAMKKKPVWGIQFHPEIEVDEAREFLQLLIENGIGETKYFERALTSSPQDSGQVKVIIHNFLKSTRREP